MNLQKIRQLAPKLIAIAQKHGIEKIYVFGSIARGGEAPINDVDFLVEMQAGASLFGVAGFCYESEKLLGIPVDVIPTSILPGMKDREFAQNIQRESIAL